MPTATRTRRSAVAVRPRRSAAAGTRRFSRVAMTPRTKPRRRAAPERRAHARRWLPRRRPQKQSRLQRMLSGMGGAMPGRRGAGGLALLAGAAGLAFKNRDKVASMVGRDRGQPNRPPQPPTA